MTSTVRRGGRVTLQRTMLTPVVNATGVLLHTNLGRAPLGEPVGSPAQTVEFDLQTGERGSRQAGIGHLLASLCGTESAMVVNNNAAAVLLVLAALAAGRDVPVSRGESVEIGGSFRVPEVMEQSGARLIDVGTTNRTRLDDYRRAIGRADVDAALVLKVHPSNYRVDGFVEATSVAELATLGIPVVVDIGSGLVDSSTAVARGWAAGMARRRAGGDPDDRSRRRPRDVQRRQAVRRPAGRHHRRPRRSRRSLPAASARPRACDPGGSWSARCRTPCSPTSIATPSASRSGRWSPDPSTSCAERADDIVRRVDHPDVVRPGDGSVAGRGLGARRHPALVRRGGAWRSRERRCAPTTAR